MSENKIDSFDILLWFILISFLALLFIPNFFVDNFYLSLWKSYKTTELSIVNSWLSFAFPQGMEDKLQYVHERLSRTAPVDLTWAVALEIERYTLRYNWIYFTPCLYLAYKSFRYKPENTGMLNFDQLIEKLTKKHYRFNRHLVKHNPQNDPRLDASRGIYAQRIKSLDYAKKNQIITLNEGITMGDDKKYDFHPETAEKVLLSSLGPKFQGFEALSRTECWMMGAFLIWLDGDRDGYHELLGDLSYALASDTDKEQAKWYAIADDKAWNIINKCREPHPITKIVQSYLGKTALGDDTSIVVHDAINALAKQFKFNVASLKVVAEIFPSEWDLVFNQKKYGTPFDDVLSMDFAFIFIVYASLLASDKKMDQLKSAVKTLKQWKADPTQLETAEAAEQVMTDAEIEVLRRYDHDPAICLQEAILKHTYTRGIILRLYDMCGDMGVVCASRFRWLKLIDRPLYMVLLDFGMPEYSAEVQAIRAHYEVERKADRKLKEPEIKHQVDALRQRILERVDLIDEL